MSKTPHLTPAQHLAAGIRDEKLADQAYALCHSMSSSRDRALAWRYRRQAEQLMESANRHFDQAEQVA